MTLGILESPACAKSARLSPCGAYRYELRRTWDLALPSVLFVMLNPSTADAEHDDPTIRKCIGFARRWGAGGISVVNLFAYRATLPTELVRARREGIDVIGPENARYLASRLYDHEKVIAAWGANAGSIDAAHERAVTEILRLCDPDKGPFCLARTKSGSPAHPLYQPYDLDPLSFRAPREGHVPPLASTPGESDKTTLRSTTGDPMTIPHFSTFAQLVALSFADLAKSAAPLVADVDGDALYEAYLAAFPPGTNRLFKKKTEFDCSCCRHFIRRAGAVVTLSGSATHTVWDRAAEEAPGFYADVARALRDRVVAGGVRDIFRVAKNEREFGSSLTRSLDVDSQNVITWEHLFTGEIPAALRVAMPDTERGNYRTTVQVFERGLIELSADAVATVLSLIEQNSLYRGEEHKPAIAAFQKMQRAFASRTSAEQQRHFVWENASSPAARFRNTVIGTLVQDLSDGQDLERAVKSFETKVAPQNYKRTSALITPAMVKQAMATIEELGLEPALERRFAVIGDVSVNDVKWVDGAAKPLMKGGIGDVLMKHAASSATDVGKDEERGEDISIDDFMARVLQEATGLEVFFKGRLAGNLMSITAPVHPEPKQLFRWSNDFAWSYRGGVADSLLRQKVASLGGRVDGVLRFSHMWNHAARNASLMDLHVFMPGSSEHRDGCHDTYPTGQRVGWNHRADDYSGGSQDVDYVEAAPDGHVPVENTTFPAIERLRNGAYTFKIHNWQLREPTKGGFRAEIEFGGSIFQYDHPEPLKHKEWVTLAVATLKDGAFTIEHQHPVGASKQDVWSLTTETYAKVSAVMLSPNHWNGSASGNRHTFFLLDGAKNDEDTRGFYSEFLHPRLEPHRKVFEVIGDKTKCRPTEGQLSGLGFSSTKKDSFLVRAQLGKRRKIFNVHVGA